MLNFSDMRQSVLACFLRISFWIKDLLTGGHIISHYMSIRDIQESAEEAINKKKCLLMNILQHAVKYSVYYKDIDSSSLLNFPVVNKAILIKHFESVKIDAKYLPWQKGEYYIQRTSGSTGTPFAVPQDTRKRNRRLAELKYFGKQVGFRSHDKLVHLRIWTKWQSKNPMKAFKENIIPFDISNLNENNLQLLYDVLVKANVKCLRGYASSLDVLARYVKEHHLEKIPSLRIAIATSETLYDSTRELVEKYLGCSIISQYANEENGILAQQLPRDSSGRFYLNEASYFIEVLKMDSDEPAAYGELGRIVITDLFNYSFPIIRYDNGDTCVLQYDQKRQKPYIAQLFGRKLDLVYNTKGEPIFPMVLARILKNYSDIEQWQFIQESTYQYRVKIVALNSSIKNRQEEIITMLKEYFGLDSSISIEFVENIPVLKSGKRKCVMCNINIG